MAVRDSSYPTGGSDSTAFGYVIDRVYTKLGDDKVVRLTIWDGENEVALYVDGSTCSAYAGDFVEFPRVGDNVKVNNSDVKVENAAGISNVFSVVKVENAAGTSNVFSVVKVKSVESGRLITTTETVNSTGTVVAGVDTAYRLASDVKVIGVNTTDKKSSTMNSIVAYTKAYNEDYKNAVIVCDEKTENGVTYYEVKAVFIDEGNKLTSYLNGTSQGASK